MPPGLGEMKVCVPTRKDVTVARGEREEKPLGVNQAGGSASRAVGVRCAVGAQPPGGDQRGRRSEGGPLGTGQSPCSMGGPLGFALCLGMG